VPINKDKPDTIPSELRPKGNKGKGIKYFTNSEPEESKETKDHHSTDDELNKEMAFNASIIRNSPIGTQPTLSPNILTTMSTTLTQTPTTTQVATATTTTGTTMNFTPNERITVAINKALCRNPGSGPGGSGGPGGPSGPEGPGGPAGLVGPAAQGSQQNVIPQAGDVRLMGSLPAIFTGNRAEAENFINGIQAYIHLNREVPGFTFPMKKVALTLTLMQGEKVAGWANDMGEVLDKLNPATDNIPAF